MAEPCSPGQKERERDEANEPSEDRRAVGQHHAYFARSINQQVHRQHAEERADGQESVGGVAHFFFGSLARSDQCAIVGSSNCNNRGYFFDSEVVGVITEEPRDWFTLELDFAHRLRMELWRRHLNMMQEESECLWNGVTSTMYWRQPTGRARIKVHTDRWGRWDDDSKFLGDGPYVIAPKPKFFDPMP